MKFTRVKANDQGIIEKLVPGQEYAVVLLPPKATVEAHPPAIVGGGGVRTVISITGVESAVDVAAQQQADRKPAVPGAEAPAATGPKPLNNPPPPPSKPVPAKADAKPGEGKPADAAPAKPAPAAEKPAPPAGDAEPGKK